MTSKVRNQHATSRQRLLTELQHTHDPVRRYVISKELKTIHAAGAFDDAVGHTVVAGKKEMQHPRKRHRRFTASSILKRKG